MKKLIKVLFILVLSLSFVFTVTACSTKEEDNFKVGLICLHDEESTYDKNFIVAMKEVITSMYGAENLNDHLEIKTGVAENSDCYTAASELAETCSIIFADSFGHEDYMIQAAREFPNVKFCHATGTKAHTVNLANYSNAFASIYEGRYLAGYAAGLKLNEMGLTTAKLGYVGAYSYAEVRSGFTAFYLGAKAAFTGTSLTMDVKYTGTWYDYDLEKDAALALITGGCNLISQHADSMGAPEACLNSTDESSSVPNVTYNISTESTCESSYVAYSKINWAPYYTYAINCARNNQTIDKDWSKGLSEGSVVYEISDSLKIWGTEAKYQEVLAKVNAQAEKIKNGEVKVFDTTTFTVGGQSITSYMADVDFDEQYTADTETVINGELKESYYRSAPYFNFVIDGITELNQVF